MLSVTLDDAVNSVFGDVDDVGIIFIGSNGLGPRFAANFNAELFHLSPYNYNIITKTKIRQFLTSKRLVKKKNEFLTIFR